MKDTELGRMLNLPVTTIQDWKNSDVDNWRYRMYRVLSTMEAAELAEKIKGIGLGYAEKCDRCGADIPLTARGDDDDVWCSECLKVGGEVIASCRT